MAIQLGSDLACLKFFHLSSSNDSMPVSQCREESFHRQFRHSVLRTPQLKSQYDRQCSNDPAFLPTNAIESRECVSFAIGFTSV
jgi:hypothetical protein